MSEHVPVELVEEAAYFGDGYQPILDFHGWRVAVLRDIESVRPEAISQVERHRETNEVFILTEGQADLIVFAGGDTPGDEYYVFPMELNVAYNIQDGVWHHCVLSEDAHIILFERTNTSLENSDYAALSPDQIEAIRARLSVPND
jgi:ureidoglycolate hydrolase